MELPLHHPFFATFGGGLKMAKNPIFHTMVWVGRLDVNGQNGVGSSSGKLRSASSRLSLAPLRHSSIASVSVGTSGVANDTLVHLLLYN